MSKVAVTYSAEVGGSSVISLKESFNEVGSEVVDADYRVMMAEIPKEKFDKLYATSKGRQTLFAHAKAKAAEFLKDVDCLALSGNSAMIDPELFNQQRANGQNYDLSRTIAELALVHVATERGMPILGICGGHQVIAVHRGGKISDLNAAELDKQRFMNYDTVKLNKDSMLAQIVGGQAVRPSIDDEESFGIARLLGDEEYEDPHHERHFFGAHNQVVSELGAGFVQTGTASDGSSIEAAETEFGVPIITTQFHPEVGAKGLPSSTFLYKRTKAEVDMNLGIFRALDQAGNAYSKKRTVLDELRALRPENDNEMIKPSQIKAAQNQVSISVDSAPKQQNTSFLRNILNIISSGYASIKEYIGEKISSFVRDRVSDKLTSDRVEKLREKEKLPLESLGDSTPSSSFSSMLSSLSPSEIMHQTPAKLWTAQDDDLVETAVTDVAKNMSPEPEVSLSEDNDNDNDNDNESDNESDFAEKKH